jgi:NitT/TauT family transport system substrate-binding protein
MLRRSLLVVAGAALVAATLSSAAVPLGPRAGSPPTVRLSTFPSYGKNSAFYVGIRRGYYRQAGIDFRVVPTFANQLTPLEARQVEIAQDLCSEVMRAIELGAPYVVIAKRDSIFPVGTFSLPRSRIRRPADYQGKRWGTSVGAAPEQYVLDTLGRKTGFDADSITIVNVPFQSRLAALVAGEVDFISGYYGSGYATFYLAAKAQGIDLDYIRWWPHIRSYGQCLAARRDWLRRNGPAARAFLRATTRAFLYSLANPARAIDAAIALNPEEAQNRDVHLLGWRQARQIMWDSWSREHGLLSMSPRMIAATRAAAIPNAKVPLSQVYTNAYIPRPQRRR